MNLHISQKSIIQLFIFISFLLISCSSIVASGYEDSDVQSIYSSNQFIAFYDLIYNAAPASQIEKNYILLIKWIDSTPCTHGSQTICKARASLVLGKQYILEKYCKDYTKAKEYLSQGLKLLAGTKQKNPSIEYLLVEGEIYGTYFLMDKHKYLFSYGVKANNITQAVWEKNKHNPRSIILKSNQLIYTPAFFGGNTKKARVLLLNLLKEELLPSDMFTIYSSLGLIEAKNHNETLADTYYIRAKEIYPYNAYIKELRSKL